VNRATSISAWRFATFAWRVDSTRAAIDALCASAWLPRQTDDWYVAQAVAMAASARRTVAARSSR
jgi:hypothetical protein